jgi:hypothetical protein
MLINLDIMLILQLFLMGYILGVLSIIPFLNLMVPVLVMINLPFFYFLDSSSSNGHS